ncbi:MAG: 4Fe-4S ferredoxin, partial [Clostridia bacterium]|nr:4Fe-4S ferredoxin [Clostridia bacterium]
MKKISKQNLNALYEKISTAYPLFLPIKKAGQVNYGLWTDGVETSVETLKTVKSPKDLFFPQSENMMKFKKDGNNIEIVDVRGEKAPFVLFGVRACDYKAIEVLDKVFLVDPVDTFYQARREAGVIVTMACSSPEESCFCGVFGIDATAPQGDVTTWMDGDNLYWQANTQKGEEWTAKVADLFVDGGEKEVEAQQAQTKEVLQQ